MTRKLDLKKAQTLDEWRDVSAVIFGLRIKAPTEEYLRQLQHHLQTDPRLKALIPVVQSFPEILSNLSRDRPSVRHLSQAVSETEILVEWITTGCSTRIIDANSGIVILPLLSLIQITQYSHFLRMHNLKHAELIDHLQHCGGIQGYCGGLPTAIAVASSVSDDDIITNVTVALRLAFVIGVYGEIGEDHTVSGPSMVVVRLKHEGQGDSLVAKFPGTHIAAITDPRSITISGPAKTLSQLYEYAKGQGLLGTDWPLRGKWHNPENLNLAEDLGSWCGVQDHFRFLTSDKTKRLLRSNRTADFVQEHDLATELIFSILAARSEWHPLLCGVARDLKNLSRSSHVLINLGIGDCTPLVAFHEQRLRITKLDGYSLFCETAYSDMDTSVTNVVSDPISHILTTTTEDADIAIVGAACRLPGANSLEDLWRLLSANKDMHKQVDTSRFDIPNSFRASQSGNFVPGRTFYGNFMNDIQSFDNSFFGISTREAANMDPQQRVILEVAYEAMEASGYMKQHRRADQNPIGCFVGASCVDFNENVSSHPPTAYTSTGTIKSFIAGKISHYFGWSGPSEVVDTACSSSLVAINRACKAIQGGECASAVAGGINIMTNPQYFMDLAKAGFLSPTGQCKPFDKDADGYCRSDGAGIVFLKPLSQARRDSDQILGIIRGVGTNQGGAATSITVPSESAQVSLYRKVLGQSRLRAEDVTYVEAHGTGTPVGDPIEMNSIRTVFGGQQRQELVHVGSIKGNLGHCETAAGVAGVLKVLAMINKGRIPPQASHRSLNPNLGDLASAQVAVTTKERAWTNPQRAALVNSYGASGSNSALIICSDMGSKPTSESHSDPSSERGPSSIILSAATESSLLTYASELAAYLSETRPQPAFIDVVSTLWRRRKRYKHALVLQAHDISSLIAVLKQGNHTITETKPDAKPVVLMLSGQSRQTINLSMELYSRSARLKFHLHELDTTIQDLGYPSILPAVFAQEPIEDPVVLQTGMVAVQLAFARCWTEAGIHIDSVVGHSLGELAALAVSGVLSERDCLSLVGYRAALMKSKWSEDKGAMLVVQASRDDAEALVAELNQAEQISGPIQIACYNGASSHVFAGGAADILKAEQFMLTSKSMDKSALHRLDVTHAFHSHLVEPILPDLDQFCKGLTWRSPEIPLEVCQEQGLSSFSKYSASAHARQSVYFTSAIHRLEERFKRCVFLECGMSTSIIPMTERAVKDSSAHSFVGVSSRKQASESPIMSDAVITLCKEGVEVDDWSLLDSHSHQTWLPPYQFDKPKHWLPHIDHAARLQAEFQETPRSAPSHESPASPPRLVSLQSPPSNDRRSAILSINIACERFQSITGGHRVRGMPMCPAALYLECAIMGLELIGVDVHNAHLRLSDVKYQAPLGLDLEKETTLELQALRQDAWTFFVSSVNRRSPGARAQHATGRIELTPECNFGIAERLLAGGMDRLLGDPEKDCLARRRAYRLFENVVQYEDFFQGMRTITMKGNEAAADISMRPNQPGTADSSVRALCDTVALDAFIQVVGLLINTNERVGKGEVMVGTGVEEMLISKSCKLDADNTWKVFTKFHAVDDAQALGDILLYSADDKVIGILMGCRFSKITIPRLEKLLNTVNIPQAQNRSPPKEASVSSSSTQSAPIMTPQSESTSASKEPTSAGFKHRAELKKLISSYTGVEEAEITETATLGELGVDSLAAREFASELEESLGITIDPADVQDESMKSIIGQSSSDSDEPSQIPNGTNGAADAPSAPQEVASTSSSESFEKLVDILSEFSGAPKESIKESAQLADIGIDSLATLEIKQELEGLFSVSLDDDAISPESVIQDIMKACNITKGGAGSSAKPQAAMTNGNAQAPQVNGDVPPPQVNGNVHTPQVNGDGHAPHVDASNLPHPVDVLARNNKNFDAAAEKCDFANYWAAGVKDQNELLLAYICEAFAQRGLDLSPIPEGTEISQSAIPYKPKHEKVMRRFFEILESHAILKKTDGKYVRGYKAPPSKGSSELYTTFAKRHPSYKCEADAMALIGPKLAPCLEGKADAMDCLFGTSQAWASMESYYHDSPLLSTATEQMVSFVTQYVRETTSKCPRPFEILEVGAGTGGTTKRLAQALSQTGIPIRYTFTDISSSLVRRAKKAFARFDWMEFEVFDLEKGPTPKFKSRYDLVIGTNTVHATSDRTSVLGKLRETLKESGFVAISEVTHILDWCDLVFGLLDGWWLAEHGTAYPLQPAEVWMSYFKTAGFKTCSYSSGASLESNTQQILLGCKTDAFGKPKSPPPSLPSESQQHNWKVTSLNYKSVEGVDIDADVYLPRTELNTSMPVALLIHGGGCFTLSKRSIRHKQIAYLLSNGILPVSINYRLCPETNIIDGAMTDIRDAYAWVQHSLHDTLESQGVHTDPTKTVVIGYSTGGHLALSLSWFLKGQPLHAPKAIICFYAPTVFKDGELDVPPDHNLPRRRIPWPQIFSSLGSKPVVAHEPAGATEAPGLAWLRSKDPRSEVVLSLFTERTGLALMLNDIPCGNRFESSQIRIEDVMATPSQERIEMICPLAQLEQGNYWAPTFLVHGTKDEVAPFKDAVRFHDAMRDRNIDCGMLCVKGARHLYDVFAAPGSQVWRENIIPALDFAVERVQTV